MIENVTLNRYLGVFAQRLTLGYSRDLVGLVLKLQGFKKFMLREYLQYKILQIIFGSAYANKLAFLGGTALRIVYGNDRFSEDLDFDNFSLTEEEFNELSKVVKEKLELEGYTVEIRNVSKGAFRCYLKIPRLLFDDGLSEYADEKILIQLDSMAHHFPYQPEKRFLNKFDVFEEIYVTPLDIILSRKYSRSSTESG